MQVDPIGYKDDLDLYTYVGDDPINRTDTQGTVLKLAVAVVKMAIKGENLYSTVQGIVENVQTIADPAASTAEKALAALSIVMDVTSGINVKDVKAVANAVGAKSIAHKTESAADRITGTYTNTHQTGTKYHGKGDERRMEQSAAKQARDNKDPVVKSEHTPASNPREAFKEESRRIEADGGPGQGNYNKINSPGKKYRQQDGE